MCVCGGGGGHNAFITGAKRKHFIYSSSKDSHHKNRNDIEEAQLVLHAVLCQSVMLRLIDLRNSQYFFLG